MTDKCEFCGEHVLDCECLNINICGAIENKIEKLYEKYKEYPHEMLRALQTFINILDEDEYLRSLTVNRNSQMYFDDINLELYPYDVGQHESPLNKEIEPGYICRCCAVKFNAVPPKNHECTWHRGICDFCKEEANLCHTSDWIWPDKPCLEKDSEF